MQVIPSTLKQFDYEKIFKTKEEASEFITLDLGYPLLDEGDKEYDDIIYEEPEPYLMLYGHPSYISENSYIVTNELGQKYISDRTLFEDKYERIE